MHPQTTQARMYPRPGTVALTVSDAPHDPVATVATDRCRDLGRSTAPRTKLPGRSLISILLLTAFLPGCAASTGVPFTSGLFDAHEIVTGNAQRQTVLSGFFLGGATAELAVVQVDENGDRQVKMYAFRGDAWVPVVDASLGPDVRFVDVANLGGRDRLIAYEPGQLNWFDPDSATEQVLLEVSTRYRASDKGAVPHVDITRDLNHDHRDDLVLPDLDGFWVLTQRRDGSFSEGVKLGPPEPFLDERAPEDKRSYREVGITSSTLPWYLSRVHQMDYNQDGRSDLVFWNQDHFDVYLQDARGSFNGVSETFTADVPFDFDGTYSLAFAFRDQGVPALMLGLGKKTRRTVLHSFRDMNGDGVADLVTLSLEGRSLLRQRGVIEVHFGAPVPQGTVFSPEAGMRIQPRGKALGLQPWGYSAQWFEDFDGDGRVDAMFSNVNVGIGKMIRVLLSGSVSLDLELYRCQDGACPEKPTARRRIRPGFASPFGRQGVFFPTVLMGDINGDGRSDLLVGKSRNQLHVFVGVPGPELLARQPRKVALALPDDERNTWLVDLNQDGKQDLIVYHPSKKEAHRLTTLMAR